MVNLKTFDNELYADLIKSERDKANTLGPDSTEISEPFAHTDTVLLHEVWNSIPTDELGLKTPEYDDSPSEGSVGTRYIGTRLYSYLPSGKSGGASCQTFLTVSGSPVSHKIEDIEDVRIKPLISPKYSPNSEDASAADPNFRGFQLALYPAVSGGGTGVALVADTSGGPIPVTSDPTAENGMGESAYWYVDYDNGMVRLSAAPTAGADYLFNPNSVYGDINGLEVEGDGYGAITLFATFYAHTGTRATSIYENQFVTIGDGIQSNGIFTGTGHNTFQSAIDSLPNGGTVFIKDGYYDFTDGYYVDVHENIELRGLQNVFIRSKEEQAIFRIVGSNVTISNIDFEIASSGNTNPSSAIQISGVINGDTLKNILVEKCKIFVDGDAYGVSFYPEANDLTFENIQISNNIFEDDLSAGWPNVNNPAFVGIINPPIGQDGTTYDSTFKGIRISDNTIKCVHTDFITMVSEFADIDGLHIYNNNEISGGNSRINVRFKANENIFVNDNKMASSEARFYVTRFSNNKFNNFVVVNPERNQRLYVQGDNGFSGINSAGSDLGSPSIESYGVGTLYVVVGASGKIATSPDGITWTNQNTILSGTGAVSVAYNGKDLWVAVGASGKIATSPDGITWTNQNTILSGTGANSVAYNGKDLWVAVGSSGKIATSPDGITWTNQNTILSGLIAYSVAHNGKDLWVAVGQAGRIATSPDGITWTNQNTPLSGTSALSVAYNGKDLWIVVGTSGKIATSPDGITWTNQSDIFGGTTARSVAYNGKDLWVVVGDSGKIATSPDGITWTNQNTILGGVLAYSVAYNGKDLWLAVGLSGKIATSPDGVTWTNQSDILGGTTAFSVVSLRGSNAGLIAHGSNYNGSGVQAHGHGNLAHGVEGFGDGYGAGIKGVGGSLGGSGVVAFGGRDGYGGKGGEFYGSVFGEGAYSKGGFSGSPGIKSYGNGTLYVAVGTGGALQTSSDGVIWTSHAAKGYSGDFDGIAYNGKDLWVAVGGGGEIQTSSNGVAWTKQTQAGGFSDYFLGIAYGNGLWVTVGDGGEIQTSSDGVVWTKQTQAIAYAGFFLGVAYNGRDLWAAVGSSGAIQTSSDGVTWAAQTAAGGYAGIFYGIAYNGKDLWVAVGGGGEIQTSPDGATWTKRTQASAYAGAFSAVKYNGKDLWVAVGTSGEIQTSPDGVTWTKQTPASAFGGSFYGVVYNGKDLWVAVGNTGAIQTSPNGVTWTAQTAASAYAGTLVDIVALHGSNAGLIAHGSNYNGSGVQAHGHGNLAHGVEGFGDGYGAGIKGVGGSLGGPGVLAYAGSNDGYALVVVGKSRFYGPNRSLIINDGYITTDNYVDGYIYILPEDGLYNNPDLADFGLIDDGSSVQIPLNGTIHLPIKLPRDSIIYEIEVSAAVGDASTISAAVLLRKRNWYDTSVETIRYNTYSISGTTPTRIAIYDIHEVVHNDAIYFMQIAHTTAGEFMHFIGARVHIGWKSYGSGLAIPII